MRFASCVFLWRLLFRDCFIIINELLELITFYNLTSPKIRTPSKFREYYTAPVLLLGEYSGFRIPEAQA